MDLDRRAKGHGARRSTERPFYGRMCNKRILTSAWRTLELLMQTWTCAREATGPEGFATSERTDPTNDILTNLDEYIWKHVGARALIYCHPGTSSGTRGRARVRLSHFFRSRYSGGYLYDN